MIKGKSAILFLLSLIILNFFDFRMIPESRIRHFQILTYLIILSIFFYLLLIPNRKRIPNSMALPVSLLFIAFLLSMFPAYIYHGQGFLSSIRAYMIFYIFLGYFILFKLDYSYDQVLKLCIFYFFFTLFIYFIDYLTLPNALFISQDPLERRGTVTIRFTGQGFTLLGTFYFLARFCRDKKLADFIIYLIGFCFMILFSGSRVQFLSMVINTIFVLLFYRREISRYFFYIIPLLLISIAVGIYYLESYITGLYQIAIEEVLTYETNVRYEAIKYFTGEFQPDLLTMILGNGYPASGKFEDVMKIASSYGFWTADLGLIGFWVYFGIIGVLAWLMIFKRVLFWKTNDNNIYIKTYFINLLTTIFLGYAIFSPSYMITTVLCLFLFDKEKESIIFMK